MKKDTVFLDDIKKEATEDDKKRALEILQHLCDITGAEIAKPEKK